MTPILSTDTVHLREALYYLSMAQRVPDADVLDDVIRRYPSYAKELTNFAIALALDTLVPDSVADAAQSALDTERVSPAVSRAMSRFHNRLHAVRAAGEPREATNSSGAAINPFAPLSRDEFRAFAARLGANTVFVAKLRDRQIKPDTISAGFRRRVADDLMAPLDLVVAHFATTGGAPGLARQFFKADGKPDASTQQSFEEAVKGSGLTEVQQRHLLSL